jgi:hypothetical protein
VNLPIAWLLVLTASNWRKVRPSSVLVQLLSFTISVAELSIQEAGAKHYDLLPSLSSFIRRVCSGYAPAWGVLRTQSV